MAAVQYEQASVGKTSAVDVFLQGDSLQRSGRQEEGKRLCDLALLLPLGDTRKTLGTELRQRGLLAGARRCWDLDLLLQQPRSWEHHYASQQLGNLVAKDEPALAADRWLQLTLSTMKAATTFNTTSSYVRMPSLILKMRARVAIKAGKVAEAAEMLDRGFRLMPGGISLAEELVPELDRVNERGLADTLYERFRKHLLVGLKDFPDSALHHNNLAWLSARCHRKLDEALSHAERAVALRPQSPTYLDTLAEVHYRQGRHEKAIELMRKCLELDRHGEHYRAQLKRFEAGQP